MVGDQWRLIVILNEDIEVEVDGRGELDFSKLVGLAIVETASLTDSAQRTAILDGDDSSEDVLLESMISSRNTVFTGTGMKRVQRRESIYRVTQHRLWLRLFIGSTSSRIDSTSSV